MRSGSNLPAYLATATLARAATEATGPALLLVSIAVLGSGASGPYLVASLTGAAAVGGPVVGAILDRTDHPKRAFRTSMITLAAGIIGLALLMGHANLPVLMALAIVTGLSYPALTGAWTAQLATLVPPARLTHAYSADAGTYSVAAILGPPAAAALLVLSTTAPLWLPIALLIIAIGLLHWVPLAPRVRTVEHSLVSDLRHGVATIIKRASLRRTVIITTIAFAGQAALFISAPILAQQLTGSLAFTGVIFAFLAAGGIVAAACVLRFPIRHPDVVVVVTTVISGIALALVAIAGNITLVIIGVFIIGLTEAPQLTAMFLIRSRESPLRVRSQVFTTSSSLRATAFAIGAALFGTMLPLGTTVLLWVGVALHALGLLAGLIGGPRITRTHLRLPDHRETPRVAG